MRVERKDYCREIVAHLNVDLASNVTERRRHADHQIESEALHRR
jgi:predicted DNA-binding protein